MFKLGQRLTSLAAVFVLSGCLGGLGGGGKGESLFYRNTGVQISSSTRYEADRFAGMWHIRAEFADEGETLVRGAVDFRPARDGRIGQIAIYGPRRSGWGVLDIYDVDQAMPGRFVVGEAPFATEYWVLWVDDDYRTAVVGTPSGSFGWILDRSRTGGADRIKAAKRVLEFNGYDLANLHVPG